MRTRTGKIARLPESIRDQLNQLLLNGMLAKDTVPWLNHIPEVKEVLAEWFNGRPITEHNVSEWRHGGYQDWLRDQETRARITQLTEKYGHLESEGRLGQRIETLMIAELVDDMDQLHRIKNPEPRSARLHRLCRQIARLQHLHCRGLELKLQQEKRQSNQAPNQTNSRPLGATRTY